LKEYNIKISILCPGFVKTRVFNTSIISEKATEGEVTLPKEKINVEKAVEDIIDGLRKEKRKIFTPK
jgi:short-subunit dehydrogenase